MNALQNLLDCLFPRADKKSTVEKKESSKKMANKKMNVYFGTETGMSEEFAELVVDEAKSHSIDATLIDLEDFAPEMLLDKENRLSLFFVSTYGDGEPTANAFKFHKWLKNTGGDISTTDLEHLTFGVFGCGDSGYVKFNAMAKFVEKKLKSFGATKFIDTCLGDDGGDIEAQFEEFKRNMFNLVSTMEESKNKEETKESQSPSFKQVKICFGTETGTSEEFSEELLEMFKNQFSIPCEILDLADFNSKTFVESINETFYVFLLSTYGVGEPTDNSVEFHDYLRGCKADLKELKYAMFGCGDSNYEYFNGMAVQCEKFLKRCGGQALVSLGMGDDSKDIHEDFMKWSKIFLTSFEKMIKSDGSDESIEEPMAIDVPVPRGKYVIEVVDSSHMLEVLPTGVHAADRTAQHFYEAKKASVLVNRELRQISGGEHGSSKHVELDLTKIGVEYKTADNIGVIPENNKKLVDLMMEKLELEDFKFIVKDHDGNRVHLFPTPCSVRDYFTLYADLNGPVRRTFLHCLEHSIDESHRKMLDMYLAEGSPAFKTLFKNSMWNVVDAIMQLKCKPSLADLIEHLPRLQARYYTGSSSSLVTGNIVDLTVTQVERKKLGAPSGNFIGTCSGYINRLDVGQEVRVTVRPTPFCLPPADIPTILVAVGCGIAPARAMLLERKKKIEQGEKMAPCLLFFGVQKEKENFLYHDELAELVDEGVMEMFTAFSRDQDFKIYVHDRVKEQSKKVNEIIMNNGRVFVCGLTHMGKDLVAAFTDVLIKETGMIESEASKILHDMLKEERYIQELWANN